MKRRTMILQAAVITLCLTACGGGNTPETEKGSVAETEVSSFSDTSAESETTDGNETESTAKAEETASTDNEASPEDSDPADVEGKVFDGGASMVNPIKKVGSSEDFKEIGLSLAVPDNSSWFEDPAYLTIGGDVAEIRFYDKIAGSQAFARAGKEELGDISGVYYKFDENKTESWETKAPDGSVIPITVKVVVEGSDFHGVLASWNYEGQNYTLWEDNGWDHVDVVAKAAMGIAQASAR